MAGMFQSVGACSVAGALLLAGCAWMFTDHDRAAAADEANSKAGAAVVVELFTSEGCSSCPPADEALRDLVQSSREKGLAIYPIAFHVDYWNRLGWKDPFSSAAASARQSEYAAAFNSQSVYTPQMIVNGRTEFVGSDRDRARKEIAAALAAAPVARLAIHLDSRKDRQLTLAFTAEGAPASTVLNVVVVERGLTTKVLRGENGGSVLKHDNVARTFDSVTVPSSGSGTTTITLPAEMNADQAQLIAFLQDPKSMQIYHAAALDLTTAK